jgi:Na+-driven multidrug efflux pump
LRAVGDTKTPLMILIVSAVINIGLNLLFVIPLKMHYTGVALATIISQFLSGGGGLWYMMKKYPVLCPKKEDWKIDLSLWKGHISLGLPMALLLSITALGCIFQQSAVNSLNDELPGVVTAYAAATKINIVFDGVFQTARADESQCEMQHRETRLLV